MSGNPRTKPTPVTLFKDPVHGYIEVPKDYCRRFIDTPIFQRLRSIEQTSMRPLFPGARHDRFVHSLGVYHPSSTVLKIEVFVIKHLQLHATLVPTQSSIPGKSVFRLL